MAWWNVIANGATIADLARQVFNSINKDTNTNSNTSAPYSGDIREILNRLNVLEKNEIRQAELIKRMAEQMNVIAEKARTATILAIISIILAAISIGWQLLDK